MTHKCGWAYADPLMESYHDLEWGVWIPERKHLFEFLTLEGAQAGLSWLSILKRREAYREAFDDFDPDRLASWSPERPLLLLEHPGIIRNRAKIASVGTNARAFLRVEKEFGGFDRYLIEQVGGAPVVHAFARDTDVPSEDAVSRALSRDLKKRGFQFVGPVICYSYLQAVGLMRDHLTTCFRYHELVAED